MNKQRYNRAREKQDLRKFLGESLIPEEVVDEGFDDDGWCDADEGMFRKNKT